MIGTMAFAILIIVINAILLICTMSKFNDLDSDSAVCTVIVLYAMLVAYLITDKLISIGLLAGL